MRLAPTLPSLWPLVRKRCEQKLGLTFDDWQHGAGRLILAERADGKLAAMIDGEATVKTFKRTGGQVWLMLMCMCARAQPVSLVWVC